MSNRGRQNVASYLVHELGLDWRLGADHFESLLLDYDVYSNYGNWNAAAGLTGGRINRFNMSKQSRDYDPQGDYIRHWVPELRRVPAPQIFEPWQMSKADLARYSVRVDSSGEPGSYPLPVSTSSGSAAGHSGRDGARSHTGPRTTKRDSNESDRAYDKAKNLRRGTRIQHY